MTKLYTLQPEHEARFPEWRDRWIANALSTEPMTDEDRRACTEAVYGMYAAAKLPPPKHVVFVPSPFVLAFAGGFSAARWYMEKNKTTHVATYVATRDATYVATRVATRDATDVATRDADYSNWYVVNGDMRKCAADLFVGDFGLACAAQTWRMWAGGNQWSAFDSYLSFFQDVAQLPLDYSAYSHWRVLAERSGPRIVHPDFCMISDRPTVLNLDGNRPHCEDGPFCRWSDGSELYSWRGVRLPARWIRERATISPAEILRCENVEQRAAGLAMIGGEKWWRDVPHKIIDADDDPAHGELIEVTLPDLPRPGRYLRAKCPRNGWIFEGVPNEVNSVLEAQSWRVGLTPAEFSYPPVRT
jgi:hypothetical protein